MYERYINWSGLKTEEEQDFTIKLPENVEVWEKTTYGLSQKDLQKIIDMNVDSVDICGLQTDACVYAISLQLFDNGIFPNVLINYTATEPEKVEYAKKMLIHQFGKVDESEF